MSKHTYYTQGVYHLINPQKYKGTFPVCYRSRPEWLLMRWLDQKDCIIEWTSESVAIPYLKPTDNRVHRYFVDFSCIFKMPDGYKQKYLLEYKPWKQTITPTESPRKSQRTILTEKLNYAINTSKWEQAKLYAKEHGYKFLVLTEKDICLN